jgi:TRAP-type C4-dicarboxylate transport system permease small subunit
VKRFLAFVDLYSRLLQKVMLVLLVIMLVGMLIMILGRYIPFIPPFLWTQEVVQFSMIWMVFLGASVAVREKGHFFVDLVPKRHEKTIGRSLDILYYGVILLFSYIYIVHGSIYFAWWNLIQTSEIMHINYGFVYFSVPLCGANSLLFLIAELIERRRTSKGEGQA